MPWSVFLDPARRCEGAPALLGERQHRFAILNADGKDITCETDIRQVELLVPTVTIDQRYRRSRVRRAFGALLFIAAGVTAALGGHLWWQDRPLRKAVARIEAGDPSGAIRIVDRYQRERPDDGRAQAIKARALVELGNSAAAIELFEHYGAEDAGELHVWAKALLMEQRWTAARPLLEHMHESGVDRADVLHELAACCLKLGDYDAALSAAEEFAAIPEFEARGQLLIGTIQHDRENLQEACKAWERVLELNPNGEGLQVTPAEFLRELGRTKLALGDPERGVELLKRSADLSTDADTLSDLGDAYVQCGLADRADAAWRQAVDVDYLNHSARVALANVALTRSDARAALEWLAPLQSGQGMNSELAFLYQRCSTMLGDDVAARNWKERANELRALERAASSADHLLRNNPHSAWAQVIRAYRFAEAGNWPEAEKLLKPYLSAPGSEPFITELANAIATRGPLPPLSRLPVKQF